MKVIYYIILLYFSLKYMQFHIKRSLIKNTKI